MKRKGLNTAVAASTLVVSFTVMCGRGETQDQHGAASTNTNTENKVISIDIPGGGLALGKVEDKTVDTVFQVEPITVKLVLTPETIAKECLKGYIKQSSCSGSESNYGEGKSLNIHADRRKPGLCNGACLYRLNTMPQELKIAEDGSATFTIPKGELNFQTVKMRDFSRALKEKLKDGDVQVGVLGNRVNGLLLDCGNLLEETLKDKISNLSTENSQRVTKEVGTDHRCEGPIS